MSLQHRFLVLYVGQNLIQLSYKIFSFQPLVDDSPDIPDPPASPDCIREAELRAESQQQSMRDLLWTLAKNYLEPNDWKRLARHWGFTEEHIQAIEHQYTGKIFKTQSRQGNSKQCATIQNITYFDMSKSQDVQKCILSMCYIIVCDRY